MSVPDVLGPISQSQATAFQIKVLDGPYAAVVFRVGDDPGTLNLQATEMPYRPLKLGGRQRVKTTYYAGNPEATQQVMGATETNTVVTGGWHDTKLGANGAAHRLATIFDGLMRTGSLLEIHWGHSGLAEAYPFSPNDDRDEVRQGVIARFEPTWDRPQDIQWECEFEWRGRGDPVLPPTFASPIQNPREGFVDLDNKVSDAVAGVVAYLEQPILALQGISDAAAGYIEDAMTVLGSVTGLLTQAGTAINNVANLPNDVIEQVRGAAINAVGAIAAIEDVFLGFRLQQITTSDLALGRLSQQRATFGALRLLGIAKEAAAVQAAALAILTQPDVLAEVRPVPGTDLRDLARQFYGDPDAWIIIARANGLVSSKVPGSGMATSDNPGLALRIPRQSAAISGLPC